MSKPTRNYFDLDHRPFLRHAQPYCQKTAAQHIARNKRAKELGLTKRDIEMYVAVDASKIQTLHAHLRKLWYRTVSPYRGLRGHDITKFEDLKEANKVLEREMKICMKLISELIDDDDFFLRVNGQGEHL